MSKIRNHVPSLKTCRRLHKKGFNQETFFFWNFDDETGWGVIDQRWLDDNSRLDDDDIEYPTPIYPAPIYTEIVDVFPEVVTIQANIVSQEGMTLVEVAALLWLDK